MSPRAAHRRAAEQGHPQAQYLLGYAYYRGDGVEQDDEVAARWYSKAAEQGHADAQKALGDLSDENDVAVQ